MRFLTALPVHNEESHVAAVLERVREYSENVLVVNDGSKDGTARELARFPWLKVVTHPTNLGYGAALKSAFQFAVDGHYDVLVTIDCDGQHQPRVILRLTPRPVRNRERAKRYSLYGGHHKMRQVILRQPRLQVRR